jgi:hypothetical protein
MPTSSIFDEFIIKDTETMKKFLREVPEEEKIKTPKIDIQKKIEEGRKVLDTF